MPNKIQNNEDIIQKVWEKGLVMDGMDKNLFRKDHCGAIIRRDMYLICNEPLSMGWEIDRIKPLGHGGTDDLNNLQPLQWENNKRKDNEYPAWSCLVGREGSANKYLKQ